MNAQLSHRLTLAEKQKQEAMDYVKKQVENAKYLNNPDLNNPCLHEKQIGQSFTSLEFDARLKKLNPSLVTEVHPENSSKRCLYWITRQGKKFISAFENGYIPEHSIWATHYEEIWDSDFVKTKEVGGHRFTHIDKNDIPKSEFVPGKGLVFDSEVQPGFKRVTVPYMEAKRGWRTVLCYVVKELIATPTEVENIFGSDDSALWARNMSKQKVVNLW